MPQGSKGSKGTKPPAGSAAPLNAGDIQMPDAQTERELRLRRARAAHPLDEPSGHAEKRHKAADLKATGAPEAPEANGKDEKKTPDSEVR